MAPMNGDWSMLDTSFHQGSGLHSFTPEATLRLLAVASQDNAATGLDVLWQICASLQRLGYPVVVLDGTAPESHRLQRTRRSCVLRCGHVPRRADSRSRGRGDIPRRA